MVTSRGDRITDRRDLGAFVPAALDDYPLTLLEFRLYCRAVRRAGDGGTFYESLGALARAWGVGDRTVREARDLLIAADLLREQVEVDEHGAPVLDEHGLPVPAREPDGRYRLQLTKDSAWCPDANVADLRLQVAARPERRPGRRTSPRSGRSDRTRRPAGASVSGQPPAAASGRPDPGSGRSDRTPTRPGPVAGTGGSGRGDRPGPVAATDKGTPFKVLPEGPPPPAPTEEEVLVEALYRALPGRIAQIDRVRRDPALPELHQALRAVDAAGWPPAAAAAAMVADPLDDARSLARVLAARARHLATVDPPAPGDGATPRRGCGDCGGTGWVAPTGHGVDVTPCPCRKAA